MANSQMEYSSERSLLGKSALQSLTLTGDRAGAVEDEQVSSPSNVLVILAFCVLTLVSTISWAMILVAVLSKGQEVDLETYDNDGPVGDPNENLPLPESAQDYTEPQAISVEVIRVLQSTPPATSAPTSWTRLPFMSTVTTSAMSMSKTTADTTASVTSTSITPATPAKPRPLNQTLFCTYGILTTSTTKFPTDGLCDYIFYDSMYKYGHDKLTQSFGFSSGLRTVLAKARSGRNRSKTQFGVGFSYGYINEISRDIANDAARVLLNPFVARGVFHFGVIDVPAYTFNPIETDAVLSTLRQLYVYVQDIRGQGLSSIIVYGSVSPTTRWNNYFKRSFKSTFKPDLFISHGYQLYEDWQRVPCLVTPPTLLMKPPQLDVNIHDLRDAMEALAAFSAEADTPSLSLSVTMKGRWSVLLPSSSPEIFSQCRLEHPPPLSLRYADVCSTAPYSGNLAYDRLHHAMRTYASGNGFIFVYDNEQALCEKLCEVKANYTQVKFGLAVFDLDYEDAHNTCSAQNRFGKFSRLKTMDRLLEFFISLYKDRTQQAQCSSIWRT